MNWEAALPYPPSVNHYWTRTARGMRMTEAASTWKDEAILELRKRRWEIAYPDHPLSIVVGVVFWTKNGPSFE